MSRDKSVTDLLTPLSVAPTCALFHIEGSEHCTEVGKEFDLHHHISSCFYGPIPKLLNVVEELPSNTMFISPVYYHASSVTYNKRNISDIDDYQLLVTGIVDGQRSPLNTVISEVVEELGFEVTPDMITSHGEALSARKKRGRAELVTVHYYSVCLNPTAERTGSINESVSQLSPISNSHSSYPAVVSIFVYVSNSSSEQLNQILQRRQRQRRPNHPENKHDCGHRVMVMNKEMLGQFMNNPAFLQQSIKNQQLYDTALKCSTESEAVELLTPLSVAPTCALFQIEGSDHCTEVDQEFDLHNHISSCFYGPIPKLHSIVDELPSNAMFISPVYYHASSVKYNKRNISDIDDYQLLVTGKVDGQRSPLNAVISEVVEELGFEVTPDMITSHGETLSARKKRGRAELITVHYYSVCLNPTAERTGSINESVSQLSPISNSHSSYPAVVSIFVYVSTSSSEQLNQILQRRQRQKRPNHPENKHDCGHRVMVMNKEMLGQFMNNPAFLQLSIKNQQLYETALKCSTESEAVELLTPLSVAPTCALFHIEGSDHCTEVDQEFDLHNHISSCFYGPIPKLHSIVDELPSNAMFISPVYYHASSVKYNKRNISDIDDYQLLVTGKVDGQRSPLNAVISEVVEELGFEVTPDMITSHGETLSARKKRGRAELITVHYYSVCLNPTAERTGSINESVSQLSPISNSHSSYPAVLSIFVYVSTSSSEQLNQILQRRQRQKRPNHPENKHDCGHRVMVMNKEMLGQFMNNPAFLQLSIKNQQLYETALKCSTESEAVELLTPLSVAPTCALFHIEGSDHCTEVDQEFDLHNHISSCFYGPIPKLHSIVDELPSNAMFISPVYYHASSVKYNKRNISDIDDYQLLVTGKVDGQRSPLNTVISEVVEELGFEVTPDMITSHGETLSARKKRGRAELITVHYYSVCLNPTAERTGSINESVSQLTPISNSHSSYPAVVSIFVYVSTSSSEQLNQILQRRQRQRRPNHPENKHECGHRVMVMNKEMLGQFMNNAAFLQQSIKNQQLYDTAMEQTLSNRGNRRTRGNRGRRFSSGRGRV
ncbi:hypothetical protein P9112_008210 [Eukaryota sp. TZLM1-RC]